MKVAEHGPGVPTAEQADAAAVDVGAEQRHGSCRAEAPYGDILGVDTILLGAEGGFDAKGVGEILGLELKQRASRGKRERAEGGCVGRANSTQVDDAIDDGLDGASFGGAAPAMSDSLA